MLYQVVVRNRVCICKGKQVRVFSSGIFQGCRVFIKFIKLLTFLLVSKCHFSKDYEVFNFQCERCIIMTNTNIFLCVCICVNNSHSFLLEDGLHGIVSCTACGQQVNHFQKDSIYRHPSLQVLICKVCNDLLIIHSTSD